MSSVMLRVWFETVRQPRVRGDDWRGGNLERIVKSLVRRVRDVDHHAQPVHLAHDVLAERRETVMVIDLRVFEVALRVGPVVRVEVGKRHVSDAEGIVVAQQAQ